MKSITIYYSQTGNTKKIAEAIHSGMSQVAEQSDIATFRDVVGRNLFDYDLIGMGAPVWRGRQPHNVTRFLEQMPHVQGKYGFTFCTHGTFPGHFISNMVTAMRRKGLIVSGWKDWYGGLLGIGPSPYYTDGHPDEIDLNEAKDFGKEIVERTIKISMGESRHIPQLLQGREYEELYGSVPPMLKAKETEMTEKEMKMVARINLNKCNYPKCSICIDNCPMESVDPAKSPPFDEESCEKCQFCRLICPTGAIETDRIGGSGDHSLFIGLAKQMMAFKELRRFRSLVPFDKVTWEKPKGEPKQHPYLIIRDGVGVPRKT